jgi:hypothetical protein
MVKHDDPLKPSTGVSAEDKKMESFYKAKEPVTSENVDRLSFTYIVNPLVASRDKIPPKEDSDSISDKSSKSTGITLIFILFVDFNVQFRFESSSRKC